MGCDIHSAAVDVYGNTIDGGCWADGKASNPEYDWLDEEGMPFGSRNYSVFAFLAGVRNYSDIDPISEPRGLPDDFQYNEHKNEWLGDHSFSWLSVDELDAFDYDATVEDRRVTGKLPSGIVSGACTAPIGDGLVMTWREFLGQEFFHDLSELRKIGADRVVFGFDN